MGIKGLSFESLIGFARRGRGASPGRPPAPIDWRATVRARLIVCAVAVAVWTTAIEARLVYLQVVDHADLMARADRQQMRT